MLKKFLDGMVFGAGFSLVFVIIWSVAFYWVLPSVINSRFYGESVGFSPSSVDDSGVSVEAPPEIDQGNRYLGSTGTYSGDFEMNRQAGTLEAGPGKIVGRVTADGEPVAGLKLQLALNGKVMSQWATSDARGKYTVSVPYGKYRVDGFKLDHRIADRVLAGMIQHPQSSPYGATFRVSEKSVGQGLDFRFVSPIVKYVSENTYTESEDIYLRWEPYPNAATYQIQVYEKETPDGFRGIAQLADWDQRPSTTETHINLRDYPQFEFRPGKYYSVTIQARDDMNKILSEIDTRYRDYDFKIVD